MSNKISLTDFVDIVSSAGTSKATKVKAIKNRDPYHPAFDYYKQLRDHIIEVHKKDHPKSFIKQGVLKANQKNKEDNYSIISSAYHSWWGKKEIKWFEPTTGWFERNGVSVSVNPELGLTVNGKPHLVKLYFKPEKLSKNRIDIITFLMKSSLGGKLEHNPDMAVLDIRRKKLITTPDPVELEDVLSAELAYVAALLA